MKFKILFLLLFITFKCFTQQNYFVYFQNENGKPFFVKYKSKVISSSPTGYLILSKLNNGEHLVKIGFPKSSQPEIAYSIVVQNSDQGFKFKSNADNQVLFNINDFAIIKPNGNSIVSNQEIVKVDNNNIVVEKQKEVTLIEKNNPTDTIQKTFNEKDSSKKVKIVELPTNNTNQGDITIVELKKDSTINIANQNKIMVGLKQNSVQGVDVVYYIKENNITDTIRIFIPNIKSNLNPETKKDSSNQTIIVPNKEKNEPKFLDINMSNNRPNDTIVNLKNDSLNTKSTVAKQIVLINSDCKKIASNEDYLNLRKKIAGEEVTEEMLKIAKNIFKQKCFMTEQIKNISVLFLNEESKFQFFELAFPYVYDTENFKNLRNEFKELKFQNKFELLIKK